jgi:hypothetical protein
MLGGAPLQFLKLPKSILDGADRQTELAAPRHFS